MADPSPRACEIDEVFESADGILAARCDAAEAPMIVDEPLYQLPPFLEHPIDFATVTAGRIALVVGARAQVIGDESAQMMGIIGRIHDDMANIGEASDQPARLKAAPD